MAGRETAGTDISPGFIQRLVAGVSYAVRGVGPENWFGPWQPLKPQAQEQTEGRQFDYPVGQNLRIQPRESENISFAQLRALADGYDLLRLVIETRKDQIESFDWEIVPLDPKADADTFADDIKRVTDFLQYPDKLHNWAQWLRMQVEDLLVIDALAVYPRASRAGDLYGFELVDGSTLKPIIDDSGRVPLPPSPAYQQVLKGIPAADYSRDQLVYTMRNPRTNRIYGYSPVEQVIMTVNIAMRRQLSQLQFYTEGNIPEAIAQTPENWTPGEVAEFQQWWDAALQGNTAAKRRMTFVPRLEGIVFPKDVVLKDEMDEWLARIVCFAFSTTPSALIKQVNRASGEQMADTAKEEGLLPLLKFLNMHFTRLIQLYLKAPGLKFQFKIINKVDPKTQADIHKTYIDAKVLTPDEVREDLGKDPMTPEDREAAFPAPPSPFGAVDPETGEPVPPKLGPDGKPLPPEPGARPLAGAAAATVASMKGAKQEAEDGERPPREVVKVDVHMAPITVNTPEMRGGDTFVTVPPPPQQVIKVDAGQTHITAPPQPLTKRIRARRDRDTGELFGEVELVGDPSGSVTALAKALKEPTE